MSLVDSEEETCMWCGWPIMETAITSRSLGSLWMIHCADKDGHTYFGCNNVMGGQGTRDYHCATSSAGFVAELLEIDKGLR